MHASMSLTRESLGTEDDFLSPLVSRSPPAFHNDTQSQQPSPVAAWRKMSLASRPTLNISGPRAYYLLLLLVGVGIGLLLSPMSHVLSSASQSPELTPSQLSTRCSLFSSPTRTSLLELRNDLLALVNQSDGLVTDRLDMPGEMSTVLSHIAMTSELQLPAEVTLTTLRMLEHDSAVLQAAQSNRVFVHSRQLFSPLSDGSLLEGKAGQVRVPSDAQNELLSLHDACSARRTLPVNPSLDSRSAPAFYDYSVDEALDEACSAGRRPAVQLSWSDNLCHDDSVYVHSLHQRISRASTGNRAGSMTFRVLGGQARQAIVGVVHKFVVVADDVSGDAVQLEPSLKGRLVGPAIVALHRITALDVTAPSTRQLMAEVLSSQDHTGDCISSADHPAPYAFAWLVEYEAFDSGLYVMELRTTWLKRAARWGPSGQIGQRPHALLHTVYRGVLNVIDHAVSPSDTRTSSHSTMAEQPLCQEDERQHDVGHGRWLPLPVLPNTNVSYCDDVVCSGPNVEYLQDEHGFSIDYGRQWVWRPVHCRLQLYSPQSFAQCLHRRNYSDLYIHGDSLAREQYQNLIMLLDVDGVIDLPKTQATAEQLIKRSDNSDSLDFQLRFEPNSSLSQPLRVHFIMQDPTLDVPDAADGRRVLLWAPRLAFGLFEERESWDAALSSFRQQLALQSRQCRDSSQLCYLYVHPTVQSQHKNTVIELWREQKEKNDYHCIMRRLLLGPTRQSVVEVMDELLLWLHEHQQPQNSSTTQQKRLEEDMTLFNMSADSAATLVGAGLGMRTHPADAITAARWDSSHDGLHYSAMCDLYECHLPTGRACTQSPPFKCPKEGRPHYKRNWNGGVSNMVTMTFINRLCNT